MLVVFDTHLRRTRHVRHRDRVSTAGLHQILCLTFVQAQLKLTLILPRYDRWRVYQGPPLARTTLLAAEMSQTLTEDGDQENQGRPGTSFWTARSRHRTMHKDWIKVSFELAQYRRDLSAAARDVVNSIGKSGSTRPG